MYEVALDEAWELFDEHLDGARSALVCVASGNGSSERSRAALNSAMASLGYGSGACTFAAVEGLDVYAYVLREGGAGVQGRVRYSVFGGVFLALEALLNGVLLCITVIGIPFGLQCFKQAKLALLPFGAVVRGK